MIDQGLSRSIVLGLSDVVRFVGRRYRIASETGIHYCRIAMREFRSVLQWLIFQLSKLRSFMVIHHPVK